MNFYFKEGKYLKNILSFKKPLTQKETTYQINFVKYLLAI